MKIIPLPLKFKQEMLDDLKQLEEKAEIVLNDSGISESLKKFIKREIVLHRKLVKSFFP